MVGSTNGSAVEIVLTFAVLGQLPSNMLITKIRPSLYLCLMAIVWSGVSVATVGVKSYSGLMGVRFALGLVEAPLLPGAIYLLGCW
jgi:fucose permease